jgi:hypothetical protein
MPINILEDKMTEKRIEFIAQAREKLDLLNAVVRASERFQ